jgi:capsular polysaccharide biosynthesis protein
MNTNNNQYIQEDEIDLRELWNTLMKRKFFIMSFTAIVTILAIVWALTRTPIYEVKSNVQVGFIGKDLIADPSIIVKTTNIVFNVEDKVPTKDEFVSEVSSISSNKKLKNFIEIKTQAISNDEALKKNKEVVDYIQNKYKIKIDQFILSNKNKIKTLESKISDLESLEKENIQRQIEILETQKIAKIDEKIEQLKNQDIKNIQRQIELLETQKIAKIDEKIKFYENIKLNALKTKIKFHTDKLNEYIQSINQIYKNNKDTSDSAMLSISSMQMVNYQNLILNSQNKIEDFKIEIAKIKNEIVPNLLRERKNIKDITIKDLELKIDNINNISIVNLEREKKNIKNDTLRKLIYKLHVELPNKKIKLLEQIEQYKFLNSENNIENSKVVGKYIIHDYPIKPKKKLIVVVAFVTGLILSIFLVFFMNFIRNEDETNS